MISEEAVVVGIDPGKTGGVVALRSGQVCLFRRIAPTINVGKRGKTKLEYDDKEMMSFVLWCRDALGCSPQLFVLERQQAFPKQGATSNFTTGVGYGLWRMALVAAGVSFEVVHPRTWTKKMLSGVPGDGKARNIIAAKRLAPGVKIVPDLEAGAKSDRGAKPHDGLADAALLALYGTRLLRGGF